MGGPGSGNRKGNTIPVKDRPNNNIDGLTAANIDRNAAKEYYIGIARQREKQRKYNIEFMTRAAGLIGEYVERQRADHKPLTVAGMQLAADIMPSSWNTIINGEHDAILYEYMDVHGIPYDEEGTIYTDPETGREVLLVRPSEVLKRFDLAIQEERESKCSSLKGNPAGNIFLLKAQQGFQDTPAESKITHNNLVIADREQAAKALALVMGDATSE